MGGGFLTQYQIQDPIDYGAYEYADYADYGGAYDYAENPAGGGGGNAAYDYGGGDYADPGNNLADTKLPEDYEDAREKKRRRRRRQADSRDEDYEDSRDAEYDYADEETGGEGPDDYSYSDDYSYPDDNPEGPGPDTNGPGAAPNDDVEYTNEDIGGAVQTNKTWMFNGNSWEARAEMSIARDRPACSIMNMPNGEVSCHIY